MSAWASVAQKMSVFSSPNGSSSWASCFADDAVEVLVDDAPVEALELEVAARRPARPSRSRPVPRLMRLDLLALGEVDAVLAEQGRVADGWLVVDQPVVGDRFAVGVGVDRLAEDLGGVAGRRGGQADRRRRSSRARGGSSRGTGRGRAPPARLRSSPGRACSRGGPRRR